MRPDMVGGTSETGDVHDSNNARFGQERHEGAEVAAR